MAQMKTDEHTEDCQQQESYCEQAEEPVFDWKKIGLFLLVSTALYLSISWIGGLDERYFIKGAEAVECGRFEEGVEYFHKSARMGGEEALYALGRCYLEGIGAQKDTVEGMRLIMESVDEAYADAQYFLAQCYYYGLYVEMDKEQAVKYLAYASRQKHPDAQCALGVCYLNGEGVEKDAKKAYQCFADAKKNGSTQADSLLRLLAGRDL